MKMPSKVYDVVKWVVIFFLPATSVLVNVVLKEIGIDPSHIVVILNAVTVFLGAITGISSYQYNKNKEDDSDGKDL